MLGGLCLLGSVRKVYPQQDGGVSSVFTSTPLYVSNLRSTYFELSPGAQCVRADCLFHEFTAGRCVGLTDHSSRVDENLADSRWLDAYGFNTQFV